MGGARRPITSGPGAMKSSAVNGRQTSGKLFFRFFLFAELGSWYDDDADVANEFDDGENDDNDIDDDDIDDDDVDDDDSVESNPFSRFRVSFDIVHLFLLSSLCLYIVVFAVMFAL